MSSSSKQPAESQSGDELLEIGRIGRSHGLKGEVLVAFSTNMVSERTAAGTRLYVGDQWMKVVASRPHQKKWLLTLEGVASREAADKLRGSALKATPLESEDQVFVHELIGKTLIDQHGQSHGAIAAVVENPASDLMELSSGALVPLAFYLRHTDDAVEVDVPPGLLDGNSIS